MYFQIYYNKNIALHFKPNADKPSLDENEDANQLTRRPVSSKVTTRRRKLVENKDRKVL